MRRRAGSILIGLALFTLPAARALVAPHILAAAQVSFEQVVQELGSPKASVRLRAIRLLRDAAYPEAAVALSVLLTDPDDEVRLEALAAELNIFLVEPIVTRKHVGLVVEV